MRSLVTCFVVGCLVASAVPQDAAAQGRVPQYAKVYRLSRTADGHVDELEALARGGRLTKRCVSPNRTSTGCFTPSKQTRAS